MNNLKTIKNWWIWSFLNSGIFVAFVLFFGFFATIAYVSEKKKNEKFSNGKHVMQEEVIYIRPAGFEEKQASDTVEYDTQKK